MTSTQIAEGAFNKLLELNLRHAKVRFEAATRRLAKLARKYYALQFLDCLKIGNNRHFGQHLPKTASPHHKRFLSAEPVLMSSAECGQRMSTLAKRQMYVNEEETPALPRNDTEEFEEEVFGLPSEDQSRNDQHQRRQQSLGSVNPRSNNGGLFL